MRYYLICLFILAGVAAYPQSILRHVEPPFWWVGMQESRLQLLIHGDGISAADLKLDYRGVEVKSVQKVENPNYLFIDLDISPTAIPGTFDMVFEYDGEILAQYPYELKAREEGSAERKGFDNSDVVYLVMPDRFSNGDPENDDMPGMLEKADRSDPDGRHGGDLQGIINHLDYIQDLGMTAIWVNPVLENNMPAYSYHGYAITDFYRVDPRHGGNEKYLEFVQTCHDRGLKVIMDQVFNHCGSYHWWMRDLPTRDWVHAFPVFTRSNYRSETLMDPYASEYDRQKMISGWFDETMPDLDQRNEFLANYLIQNSIWWVEYAGLDGIRMDTYPYSYKDFMIRWIKRIRSEYPNFNVVGEAWLQKEAHTAYFLEDPLTRDGYNSHLPLVTDFPMHFALVDAFTEENGWTTGISRLYYVLTHDYLYSDPMNTLVFADNHDLDRFYTSVNEDLNAWKMAMTFLITTRGIPMVYYGTEILMTGEEQEGHGFIREDFPGGWAGDEINCFIPEGRDEDQQQASEYLRNLLEWRKDARVIHEGKYLHFIPDDGLYVFFRYLNETKVMVVLNNHPDNARQIDPFDYEEMTGDYEYLFEITDGMRYGINETILVPPRSAKVFELE